jgi:hypothetical protein
MSRNRGTGDRPTQGPTPDAARPSHQVQPRGQGPPSSCWAAGRRRRRRHGDAKQACADSVRLSPTIRASPCWRQRAGISPLRSAMTACRNCRAIAASRASSCTHTTCARCRRSGSRAAPAKRYGVTVDSKLVDARTPRRTTPCRCWHSHCNGCGASSGQAPLAQRPFRQDWRSQLAPRFQLRKCRPASPPAGSRRRRPGCGPTLPRRRCLRVHPRKAGIAPYRLDQLDRLILGPGAPPTQGRASGR